MKTRTCSAWLGRMPVERLRSVRVRLQKWVVNPGHGNSKQFVRKWCKTKQRRKKLKRHHWSVKMRLGWRIKCRSMYLASPQLQAERYTNGRRLVPFRVQAICGTTWFVRVQVLVNVPVMSWKFLSASAAWRNTRLNFIYILLLIVLTMTFEGAIDIS